MASEQSGGALVSWYRNRIGEPTNADEVYGYWLFAVGVVLGALGILLFLLGDSASGMRRFGIALAAGGLLLLVAGPMYRLPLRREATYAIYAGGLVGLVAVAWFFVTYPGQWTVNPAAGRTGSVISLYVVGLAVMAIGGIVVPLVAGDGPSDLEGDLAAEAASRAAAEAAAAEGEAEVTDLRQQLADREAELDALRESSARFELFEDNAGEHRWRLRHRNGNIIADSGEGYTRKHNARKGLASVKRNALGAPVIRAPDIVAVDEGAGEPIEEGPAVAPAEEPPIGDTDPVAVDPPSRADFEVYEDEAGEYRWRLVHENGNILADSGQGYTRRGDAREAAMGVRDHVGPADYLDVDPTAFEIYADRAGQWRWHLIHENGNILADSGEGYSQRWNAKRAVDGVVNAATGETNADFEVYEDNRGEHRWRLVHANGNILADSGEGYADASGAREAVERVETYAPEADVLDIGNAAFEIYADAADEWRWRLRHRNGNILADSGQSFGERSDAAASVDRVKRNAEGAAVTEG